VSTASYWTSVNFSQASFIAANAVVMGSVNIAAGASIWYGAVVRGDVERIEIGECTNIQDGAILHGDPGFPTILEDHITVAQANFSISILDKWRETSYKRQSQIPKRKNARMLNL
jgi:carbonic anhydrase/acetyltransferase-like protein (isoleucine patch superfamily)